MALLTFAAERRSCSNRSISPGRRAKSSSKSAAAAYVRRPKMGRMDRQTDKQTNKRTDRRTPDSFIDLSLHTMRAVSITHSTSAVSTACTAQTSLIRSDILAQFGSPEDATTLYIFRRKRSFRVV